MLISFPPVKHLRKKKKRVVPYFVSCFKFHWHLSVWNDRGYNIIGKPARPFLPGKKEQIIGFDQTLSTDDEENEKKMSHRQKITQKRNIANCNGV